MVSYFRNSPWQGFVRSPDFAAAWRALQQGSGPVATAARTKTVLQRPTDVPALAALLPSLRFADVEQGITPYNKDAIPAG
jgi:hypothetical protein